MKTTNIKGKEYVTVNERLKEFRNTHKDYSLISRIVREDDKSVIFEAQVIDDKGVIRANGFARETLDKGGVNKFAMYENAETSAWGRALGNFGIGIDTSVCSADELVLKLSQENASEKSDFTKEAATEKAARTKAINKAKASGDAYQQPQQKPLSERFEKARAWLATQTPESFKNATKSVIDSLNQLVTDLSADGSISWAEEIKSRFMQLSDIDDNINY